MLLAKMFNDGLPLRCAKFTASHFTLDVAGRVWGGGCGGPTSS